VDFFNSDFSPHFSFAFIVKKDMIQTLYIYLLLMITTNLSNYQQFLNEIMLKIQTARYEMLKSVSKQTVLLYRELGKSVSEKVENADW
jgi:hypothetical protein